MKAVQMKLPNQDLINVLLPLYNPCANFGVCKEAQWNPTRGQIPRGFIGATGCPEDVEVVMVFSEPGHPHYDEGHNPNLSEIGLMASGMRHVYQCYKSRTDTFHKNVRWFMAQLYPDLSFDDQLKYIWLTEGRLCSIDNEIGSTKDRTCANHYLTRQLAVLPNASVIAFGGKAKHYLKGLGIDFIGAYALAPPGANHKPAMPSWQAAIQTIQERRLRVGIRP